MNVYREHITSEDDSAKTMLTRTQQSLSDKNEQGLIKASKNTDKYFCHALKKIKKQSSKGSFWMVYSGPWWNPLNKYDATLLLDVLKAKGFKADIYENFSHFVKIQIFWSPSS